MQNTEALGVTKPVALTEERFGPTRKGFGLTVDGEINSSNQLLEWIQEYKERTNSDLLNCATGPKLGDNKLADTLLYTFINRYQQECQFS